MKGRFVVAQSRGEMDPQDNFRRAQRLVKEARDTYQADLILFPETFMSYGVKTGYAGRLDGPFVQAMGKLAQMHHIWIVFGMREQAGDKNYNTIVVFDEKGSMVSSYHKTHLYDAFSTRESDEFLMGDHLFEPIHTPFGKLGLFVCYELRFPEIARFQALRGAEILLMPTAWVIGKRKQEQLQILASARALENTCYLLVSNLCGAACTGGSMIIDPLGEIIEQADQEEALLFIEIDTEQIQQVREKLPSLKNRRPELY